jgi:hypothetical protein
MTNLKWVSLLYTIGALAPIGTWFVLLFAGVPENQTLIISAISTVSFMFSSENSHRWWFVGWSIIPFYLLALAGAYLSSYAKNYKNRQFLFGAAFFITAYSFVFAPPLGFVLLGMLFFSYSSIKNP